MKPWCTLEVMVAELSSKECLFVYWKRKGKRRNDQRSEKQILQPSNNLRPQNENPILIPQHSPCTPPSPHFRPLLPSIFSKLLTYYLIFFSFFKEKNCNSTVLLLLLLLESYNYDYLVVIGSFILVMNWNQIFGGVPFDNYKGEMK